MSSVRIERHYHVERRIVFLSFKKTQEGQNGLDFLFLKGGAEKKGTNEKTGLGGRKSTGAIEICRGKFIQLQTRAKRGRGKN